MPTEFPKLRQDLVVSRQETAGGLVFIIKDPALGRFVRFKEPEYFIAQQLDGMTPLEEVRRRGEEHFGATLPESTLTQFTQKLLTLGFLDQANDSQAPVRESNGSVAQGRLRGNAFYLRLKVFDPDRLLEWLVPKLRFFYTRTFAVLSVGVILLAAYLMAASWDEIHRSLPRLYRIETVFLAWATFLIIVIGHEFAHGLTCKRYGGKVHEIGLMLIYLHPAMYCNVSDAWLFPEKKKRLLVTLAGAWFEVFCWALAMLCWRLTDPATLLNYLALVAATTLGIKSLFNLNPLIKLDGYYLLSDFLEMPNLRRNAFQYIGARIKSPWRSHPQSQEIGERERRIFWLYGLLAGTYSVWFIGYLLASLGAFLVGRYQTWGLVGFAALLVTIFRVPLKKGARLVASLFTPTRGILNLLKRLLRILAVGGIAAACLYFIKTDLKVSGEFRVLPIHNADVRADVEGIVEEILREEGDTVQAGEVIARLSDRDYRAEQEKVKAEIAEKQAQLRMLKAGARSEELELARTIIIKGEERLKYARAYLEMERTLYEEKLSSKKDFEVAEELVSLRAKELEESKGNLKLLLAGSRPEAIEAMEAEVSRLVSQQRYLEDQLKRLRIVSPIAGIVTTHRLKDKLGANLKKGDLVAEVHDLQTVTAEISVPEKEISDVSVGQLITLKARAHVGSSFHGKVKSITPVASKPAQDALQREFLVITELENKELKLRPEMSGNAKIYCGKRRLYEIVFRRLIRFVRVEFWSLW